MNKLVLMGEKQNRSRIVFLGVTLGHVKLIVLKRCTQSLAQPLSSHPVNGTKRRTGEACVPGQAAAQKENDKFLFMSHVPREQDGSPTR